MSRKQHELEGRLDDLLMRIAKETQEIKDLEQQLTDGQIAANEALKRDLEDIILGLQEYLHSMKDQARQARSDCLCLQGERDALQHLLQEKEQQLYQLQKAFQVTDSIQKNLDEFQTLKKDNMELRDAKAKVHAYESQLRERDCEAEYLKGELSSLRKRSQLEHSALQAELQTERETKKNALTRLQLAAEREVENTELLKKLNLLQQEKATLMKKVSGLQNDLHEVRRELLCPKQVAKRLERLRDSISSGSRKMSKINKDGDLLGDCLAELQEELHRTVSEALQERDEAQNAQDRLTHELRSLRHRFLENEQKYLTARDEAEQAVTAKRLKEEAELLQLRENLHEAQNQQYLMQQRLQDAENEQNRLLTELEKQDKQMRVGETRTREQVQFLDLELQELKRSFSTADRMAVEQLNAAKEKIRSLHSTVERISQERAEDAEELQESRVQAACAMQDLTKAEQEIQVLQKLLQDRIYAFDDTETVDNHKSSHPSISQFELTRLNRELKRQQSQTKRLRDQLAQAMEDNSENLDELLEEIEVLRDTLLQQSNYLSKIGSASDGGGQWYYVPPGHNPSSVGSEATPDSGVGFQHVTSPTKGTSFRGKRCKVTRPTSSTGYWVYSPHPEQQTYADREPQYRSRDEESIEDGTPFTPPPGSVIYTVPPDGTPLPPGRVIYAPPVSGLPASPGAVFYGPPPEGVSLVYGPPPTGLHIPLIPNGTLLCNVPGHLDMEHTLKDAQDSLKEQESGKKVIEQELHKLEEHRSELQIQLKDLQQAVNRLQRQRRHLESTASSADEESLINEVKCLDKNLVKRKSKLREVGQQLLKAEADLKDTRAKTRDTQQRSSEMELRLKEKECELKEIERQTQENTRQLGRTRQQYRELQEEVQDLQKYKLDEENSLQKIENQISARGTELQEVNKNLDSVTNKLENLQMRLQETQSQEAKLLINYKDSEEIANQRRKELEQLNTQLLLAKEEQSLLGRKLDQWREEEAVLKASMEKNRFGLVGVLRQGEEEAQNLEQHIKELRVDVQNLSVQKGELESQLLIRKRRLVQYKKAEHKEKDTVQKLRSVISKHKQDLKRVLDMIQLETAELERLKSQHNQKRDQLEKSQENLLQVRSELQGLQQELEEQQHELERQRRLRDQDSVTFKEQADAANAQRSSLLEQCTNLEARRTHANRCLETAENAAQKAEAQLMKLQEELNKLKQEHKQAECIKEQTIRESTTIQKQLDEKNEELNKLKERESECKLQLKEMIKKVENSHKELDNLNKQQREQKVILQDKLKKGQQKEDVLEKQLKDLEAAVLRKQTQYEQEEECLRTQQQQSLEWEDMQRRRQQKLQSQLQALEEAVAQQLEKMAQVTDAVEELENKRQLTQSELHQSTILQARVTQLEQDLADSEVKVWARTEAQSKLREELEACRSEIQLLQDTLTTEKCRSELWRQAEGEIKDTMRFLRAEVRAELDNGIKELELHPSDTESYEETHAAALQNVQKAAYNSKDELWRKDALREKLRQHEDHLKAQLRKTMFSQQEALSLRRQQTEGSIQGLRRRLDKLDQLLSKSGHESLYCSDSETVSKYSCSDTENWRQECSFSPIRLDPCVPEKDQTQLLSQLY